MATEPLDLDEARAQIERGHALVGALAAGTRRWKMSIPADPERDSDLILSAALTAGEVALAEVERLRQGLDVLRVVRNVWIADRNKLARECADLRDAADTTRTEERERIARWFVDRGDDWRHKNNSEAECEWDWAAGHIRDGVPNA